ncbi:nucleoside-binding protein [Micromonospora pattaloongensis]|uniref:Nucleoside-binding protein n=1 Tax=Micromonospora pattaloongensis TaxID=405436 RepID=A0A1H3GGJ9_9ACTN|nr:BMP family ABC transporter substrate-binding protein [Micromonospora pattaloongensis]SDY02492.1 nucleoside-binding protein [Micromonospora pattaloongensis]
MRIVSVFAVGGLALSAAACGEAPKNNEGGSNAANKYTACMVTDTGGIDDKSFNAGAWAGLQAAQKTQSNVDPKYVASAAEADYEPNLTQYVNQKCNFILAVGGLMRDATLKIAQANANQEFGIVDSKIAEVKNVYPMQFDTAQAAFLAGYLAAGYSKTGTVATYGGMKIPPVTIFMDGFVDGVAHYNKVKNKDVKVLGWNKATQNGTFAEAFTDQAKGKAISDTFVAQRADVIMPVAGGTGLGTASAAKESGKFSVIWVDSDGCESAAQYCSAFLSTVEKNISGAVEQAVVAGAKGDKLDNATGYVGTLANDGVSLAPYHEFDGKVPAELKAEVEKLKADVVSGAIKVESPNSPTK